MGRLLRRSVFLLFMLSTCTFNALAQEVVRSDTPIDAATIERLNELGNILKQKRAERTRLLAIVADAPADGAIDEREQLTALSEEITRLREAFELMVVGDVDLALLQEPVAEYDWRQEMVEIVSPLLETLKSVTQRPRQKTELRESIALNSQRLSLTEQVIASLEATSTIDLDPLVVARIEQLLKKWQSDRESYSQALLLDRAQLERLDSSEVSFFNGMWPAVQRFLLGRGLTLALAAVTAVLAWVFMRFIWWVFSSHLVSKEQRRNRVWFRLLSYSYFILNLVVVMIAVIAVLYVREDLLLLALAVVLIAVTALGLRRFVPAYLREARLLLNIGSVREGERLMYRGLPWQVMSLNLYTVLRNPALDGVLRIPLGDIAGLSSRPAKDKLWFPCRRNDYLLLPDNTFALVKKLTPELVQLEVHGGMLQSWPTADFYSLSVTNLSRGESYGVGVTFGFGYELQPFSLSLVAPELRTAIESSMREAGLEKELLNLLVDFSSAGDSSLNYIIYATIDSAAASSYFKVKRIIQQACVEVANQQGWSIPYPQMTIHRLPIEAN